LGIPYYLHDYEFELKFQSSKSPPPPPQIFFKSPLKKICTDFGNLAMLSIGQYGYPQFIFMEAPEPNTQIQQELVNSIIQWPFGIIFGHSKYSYSNCLAIKSNIHQGVIGAAIYGFVFFTNFLFPRSTHGFQTC